MCIIYYYIYTSYAFGYTWVSARITKMSQKLILASHHQEEKKRYFYIIIFEYPITPTLPNTTAVPPTEPILPVQQRRRRPRWFFGPKTTTITTRNINTRTHVYSAILLLHIQHAYVWRSERMKIFTLDRFKKAHNTHIHTVVSWWRQ